MPKKKEKKPKKSEEEIAAEEAARAAELSQKRKELEELTIENEALKAISRELGVSLEKHIQTQTSIITDLDDELNKAEAQLNHWMSTKNTLVTERAVRRKQHLAQKEDLKTQIQTQLFGFKQRHASLQRENDSLLMRHKENKEELYEQLDNAEREMVRERDQHRRLVGERENKYVMEKAALKRDMQDKIKATKFSLLDMTEDQLHTTTKRTIEENNQNSLELQYQSAMTEKMMRLVEKLKLQKLELLQDVDLELQGRSMIDEKASRCQAEVNTQTRRLVALQQQLLEQASMQSFHGVAPSPKGTKPVDTSSTSTSISAGSNISSLSYITSRTAVSSSSPFSSSSSQVHEYSVAGSTRRHSSGHPSDSSFDRPEGSVKPPAPLGSKLAVHAHGENFVKRPDSSGAGGNLPAYAVQVNPWPRVGDGRKGRMKQLDDMIATYVQELDASWEKIWNNEEDVFRVRSQTQRYLTLQSEACLLLAMHIEQVRMTLNRERRRNRKTKKQKVLEQRKAVLDAAAGIPKPKGLTVWPVYRGIPGRLSDIRLEDADTLLQLLYKKLHTAPHSDEYHELMRKERDVFFAMQKSLQKPDN